MHEALRERLAKILGMLGSTHDGEVLAAARAAEACRIQSGLTWGELLLPQITHAWEQTPREAWQPPPPPRDPPPRSYSWKDAADILAADPLWLTTWERDFLASVASQRRMRVSPKQAAIIERLYNRHTA